MMITRYASVPFIAAALLWHGAAFADSVTVKLSRVSLLNVNDSAGFTQREAGSIIKGTKVVGDYYVERRSDTLTGVQFGFVHPTKISLVFTRSGGNEAGENITIEGVHDFNSGDFKGSVSAASSHYSWAIGASATYVPAVAPSEETLTLQGSFTGMHLP